MKNLNEPTLIERPGFFGRKKKEKHETFDAKYGQGNWGIVWRFGRNRLNFVQTCLIYEDAYFMDSFNRENLWRDLFKKASDFYDNEKSNVNSALDYTIQESYSTHLQDIAVRRVGIRRGWKPEGKTLIQIRGPDSEGFELMPGRVPFHLPELIERPDIIPSWADPNSVEAFYQNNKWIAVHGITNSFNQTTLHTP